MSGPRTLYVDPRPLARSVVPKALRGQHNVPVAATADDLSSALLQAQRVRPEVVTLSTAVGTELPAYCARLAELDAPVRVLVVDRAPDQDALLNAIESGADGYVSGAYGLSGLAAAIRAIGRGESVVPASMIGPLLRRLIERQREAAQAAERLVNLTPREREVLSLLVEGLGQDAIAERLVISPETVRTHLQRLLRKLDVRSRAEAIALVARTGLADRLESIVERSAS